MAKKTGYVLFGFLLMASAVWFTCMPSFAESQNTVKIKVYEKEQTEESTISPAVTSSTKEKTLPKTGETKDSMFTVIGIVLLTTTTTVFFKTQVFK